MLSGGKARGVCGGSGGTNKQSKFKNTKTTTTTPIQKQSNPTHPNNNKNNNPKMLKLGVTDALETKPTQCSHKTATIFFGKRAALINTRHKPEHYREYYRW